MIIQDKVGVFFVNRNFLSLGCFILLVFSLCMVSCSGDGDIDSKENLVPSESSGNIDENAHLAKFLFGKTWDYFSGDLKSFFMENEDGAVYNHEMSIFTNGEIESVFTISPNGFEAGDIGHYSVIELGNTRDSITIRTFGESNKIECKVAFIDALKNKLKIQIGDKNIIYHKRVDTAPINKYMIYGNWEYLTNNNSNKKKFLFESDGTGSVRSNLIGDQWFGLSHIKWSMESEGVMLYCPDYIVESVGTEHWYIQFCNKEYMKLDDMYLRRVQ
ncbi:MAG: hypothetical protein J6K74_02590 [Marinifilaceae bacterium]|nr:hypothetical protein [Marinifilaceae bacterium]